MKFASNRLKLAHMLGATFKYQQDVIACKDRFRTVKKPRQAGMTTCFAIETLIDSLIHDDYVTCLVSPTKRQSDRVMRYIKQAFRKLELKLGQRISTEKWTTEEIFFPNGSEIYSFPNNPLGIQGVPCNSAVIDEGGLFTITEGEAIMDALVGSLAAKQGRLTISGKPRGKRGLLWQYWDPLNTKYKSFTHFSIDWKDRAAEDPKYGKEVEKHRGILSKLQFDETYNALFIDEGILIFPHAMLEQSSILWEKNNYCLIFPEGTPSNVGLRYIGIDFGRKRSLTEIHVLQKENDGFLRSLLMKSLVNMNFEKQKEYIDDLIVRINPVQVKIDERGMGLPLLDYFDKKHGKKVQPLKLTEGIAKERIILQCRNAFADGILAIPYEDKLYEQLHSFQKEYTPAGNVKYFGKVDETDFLDDKVIALAAAVDATQGQPFSYGII